MLNLHNLVIWETSVDTEKRKVDRFGDGLDITIRKGLSSQVFTKYQDTYQREMRVEIKVKL